MTSDRPLTRVCFQLQVKPERLEEYRARHAAVWPEMLEALATTGWSNYSLFIRDDGLLIGYVETPSLAEARAGMAMTTVNARWQAEMAGFFVDLDGAPDEGFVQLTEIFHLEDQLAPVTARADAALADDSTLADAPAPTHPASTPTTERVRP